MTRRDWLELLLVAVSVIVLVPLVFIEVWQFFQGVQ